VILIKLNKTADTACLFLTALIWGLTFVWQLQASDVLGTFTFISVRFFLGAVSLIPVIYIFERDPVTAKDYKITVLAGIAAGLILFTAASLQQIGIAYTGSAGKAGFITGLYMILVPVLGVFFGRKTSVLTWAGAVSAVLGLYLLSVQNASSIEAGDIILFIGAFFWAGHIFIIDRFAKRIKVIRFSMVQFITCGVLSAACALIFENITLSGISDGIVPILFCGLLSTGLAYTLQIIGQKGVDPPKAAIIFSLETLFSAIGGAILLGEKMSTRGYAGCAFIFAGIIVSQITVNRKAIC